MAKKTIFGASLKKCDLFSTDIAFRENGRNRFGSIFGACTSLIIVLIVASYGFNKFLIMINYEDTNFNEFIEQNQLSEDELGQEELEF